MFPSAYNNGNEIVQAPGTSPWTVAYPMKLDNDYQMFEYACHEGNYGLPNILSAARAAEKK